MAPSKLHSSPNVFEGGIFSTLLYALSKTFLIIQSPIAAKHVAFCSSALLFRQIVLHSYNVCYNCYFWLLL